jgi:D-alanine-D-alanine ligase-like ATP-grasp enzyme
MPGASSHYVDKYVDDPRIVIPADLPPETSDTVRRFAVDVPRRRLPGLARVDFFLSTPPAGCS